MLKVGANRGFWGAQARKLTLLREIFDHFFTFLSPATIPPRAMPYSCAIPRPDCATALQHRRVWLR
jgi:hypothetical protein